MIESPLKRLSRVIYDFMSALKDYEKFSERELYSFLSDLEDTVDEILSQHKVTSITDARFRAFQDVMREYETVMRQIKEAMSVGDYMRVRALLPELETTVRRANRIMSVIATGSVQQIVDISKELEMYIGENIHEFDDRIRDLSYTARQILAHLVDSPMKELHLNEIMVKLGITDKKGKSIVSDAVGELVRKLPDLVELVPDTRRRGYKIRIKR